MSDEAEHLARGLEALHELDSCRSWGANREDALHADAFGDLADRHGLAGAGAAYVDHEAFEDLDTLLSSPLVLVSLIFWWTWTCWPEAIWVRVRTSSFWMSAIRVKYVA